MKALKKGLLEMGRVVVLAIIPVLIAMLESNKFDWRLLAVVAMIAGLKFLDEYLHEVGKETDNDILIKGITRF